MCLDCEIRKRQSAGRTVSKKEEPDINLISKDSKTWGSQKHYSIPVVYPNDRWQSISKNHVFYIIFKYFKPLNPSHILVNPLCTLKHFWDTSLRKVIIQVKSLDQVSAHHWFRWTVALVFVRAPATHAHTQRSHLCHNTLPGSSALPSNSVICNCHIQSSPKLSVVDQTQVKCENGAWYSAIRISWKGCSWKVINVCRYPELPWHDLDPDTKRPPSLFQSGGLSTSSDISFPSRSVTSERGDTKHKPWSQKGVERDRKKGENPSSVQR